MRILVSVATAALIIGVAGSAYAAEATGVIKSLNSAKDMVTLDNGSMFDFAKNVNLSGLRAGEKVTIAYQPVDDVPNSVYTNSGGMKDATVIMGAS
jgi:hypothetical protein